MVTTNFFKKWTNIAQDQFVLKIVKFVLTMKFAKVPVCQFLPPLNFSPVETEIIHAEISKRLSKGLIVNTTRVLNDYVSRIFPRTKKDSSYRMIQTLIQTKFLPLLKKNNRIYVGKSHQKNNSYLLINFSLN